ncbi:MAG TPA: riboflavin synthase, partial [Verrucomicrobiae bacterium]
MFTGIVAEAGVVQKITPTTKSIALVISAGSLARGLQLGASVAVNGCCLTLVKLVKQGRQSRLHFDVLQESWTRTNLQFLKAGALVNLERPLRADGELGGHFVTGHVDGIGRVKRWEKAGMDFV